MIKLHYFIAFAGIWALGNGVLHDVFILLQRRPFDRELIRLMIDGHILIFSGILYCHHCDQSGCLGLGDQGLFSREIIAEMGDLACSASIISTLQLWWECTPLIAS